MIRRVLLAGVLSVAATLGSALAAAADDVWEVSFDEAGVLVETRDVDGSDYKAFRATARLPAPLDDVLARLRDIDSYPDWFPDTLEARRISAGEGEWRNYIRTDAPWPVKDRDAVYRNRLIVDDNVTRIEIEADPDAAPEVKDAVRVRAAGGFWELSGDDGFTDVYWEFHLEPGGNIPANLANARVVETPRKALLSLKAYFSDD